jgi:hypothetical protein
MGKIGEISSFPPLSIARQLVASQQKIRIGA